VSARADFLAMLRAGLRGAPESSIDEILADYNAHFDEGVAARRSESDVATALGDPLALASELRMELRLEEFEAAPSAQSAAEVVSGVASQVAGRGFMNVALLCLVGPVLAFSGLAAVIAIVTAAGFGLWFLVGGSSLELPGGIGTPLLCGLGLLTAAISLTAFLVLAANAVVSGLAKYARHQYRHLTRPSNPGTPP